VFEEGLAGHALAAGAARPCEDGGILQQLENAQARGITALKQPIHRVSPKHTTVNGQAAGRYGPRAPVARRTLRWMLSFSATEGRTLRRIPKIDGGMTRTYRRNPYRIDDWTLILKGNQQAVARDSRNRQSGGVNRLGGRTAGEYHGKSRHQWHDQASVSGRSLEDRTALDPKRGVARTCGALHSLSSFDPVANWCLGVGFPWFMAAPSRRLATHVHGAGAPEQTRPPKLSKRRAPCGRSQHARCCWTAPAANNRARALRTVTRAPPPTRATCR
jgi:hypothetical protein